MNVKVDYILFAHQMAAMCEIEANPGRPAQCTTENFIKSDGRTFCGFFLAFGLTWYEADRRCKAQGARLPEIQSLSENNQILKLKVRITLQYIFAIILVS